MIKQLLVTLIISVGLIGNVYANDNKLSYLCNQSSGTHVFLHTVNIDTKTVTSEFVMTRPFEFHIQTYKATIDKDEISYNSARVTKTIINRKTLEMFYDDERDNIKNLIRATNCELQKDYTTGKKRFIETAHFLETLNSNLMN